MNIELTSGVKRNVAKPINRVAQQTGELFSVFFRPERAAELSRDMIIQRAEQERAVEGFLRNKFPPPLVWSDRPFKEVSQEFKQTVGRLMRSKQELPLPLVSLANEVGNMRSLTDGSVERVMDEHAAFGKKVIIDPEWAENIKFVLERAIEANSDRLAA